MEAVVTITKVATTAPSAAPVIEGVVTATKVAPFVEGAVTTTNAVGGTVEATEIVSKTTGALREIEKAAPDALKAAEKLEQGLETVTQQGAGPDKVLQDFTASTSTEVGAGGDVAVEPKDIQPVGVGESTVKDAPTTSQVSSPGESSSALQSGPTTEKNDQIEKPVTKAEEALNSQTTIDQKIENSMLDWDEKHPIPADKKGYNKYVEDRVAAEKEYTVSARVENDMQAWKKENPEASEKDIATQKQKLEKEHGKNYDREVREGQKEHDGMSAAEFAKKVEELKTLRVVEARMIQAIEKNDAIKNRTSEIEAQRQVLQDMRNYYSAQADALQSVLEADAASSKSGWKRVILPSLMVGMVMAGPAVQAANDDGSK